MCNLLLWNKLNIIIKQGDIYLNNFINIEQGRYYVERVFSNDITVADIIEKQVLAKKGTHDLLTDDYKIYYNDKGGSIVGKEALQ